MPGLRPIRRFARLSWAERAALVRALLLVSGVRLALWVLPFRLTRRATQRLARTAPGAAASEEAIARTIWAVVATSRRVPGASCLTQALAAQVLIARLGRETTLRVGVTRDRGKGFAAHAWLEYRGRIIIGGGEVEHFTPLPIFDHPRP